MELVHHIHLAEKGPTQTEKTVKMSVMLTRHAGAIVTSTDFWLLFTLQCQCCVVDLFWWLAKLRAYVNDYWSIPASTCRETGSSARAAMHSCRSTTDLFPKLKIQYSFMELQILRLIKFSSCRQSFTSFSHWWFMGWKSRVHLPYCLSFAYPPPPAFLLEDRFQNERDVKKKKKKSNSQKNDRPVSKQFTRGNICAKEL